MQAVSIESLLSGRPEGHSLRWAIDFVEKHADSTDSAIQALRDHCEDAKSAKQLGKIEDLRPRAAS